MKNRSSIMTLSILALSLILSTSSVLAAPKATGTKAKMPSSSTSAPSTHEEPVFREATPMASSPSSADFSKTVSLGLTSLGGGAISGMIDLGSRQTVQAYAGIGGTSGVFQFTVGGLYRMGIFGTRANGFHLGGGVELGTTMGTTTTNVSTVVAGVTITTPTTTTGSVFFVNVLPLAGIHFSISGVDALSFSVDAGPQVQIQDGNANLTMGPLSGLLGASVHYAVF